jgi:anti-sigma regulatory factor (Ser/Thr protein kinase)
MEAPLLWTVVGSIAFGAAIGGAAAAVFFARRAPAVVLPAAVPQVPLATLLPAELPIVDGLRLSASYVPGDGDAAGGAFYDAFFLDDDRIAFAVGAADGGGPRAVAAMNVVRHALRNAFFDGARPPDGLRRANRALLRSEAPMPVAAIAGVIDPATLQLRYACAGHPPPMLAADDASVVSLPAPGTSIRLGVMVHHVTSEQSVTLAADGLCGLCSCSGIDAEDHAFGAALREARALRLPKPAVAIDRALAGRAPRLADSALLVIATEPTIAHVDVRLPAEPASSPLARNALRRFFAGTPLDERRTYDALVAVGEAVSNVIEHAYPARPNQTFDLRARNEGDECTVVVEDTGHWRDDGPPAGRGVALMRRLSDGLQIERTPRGTRVALRFAFVPSIADVALHVP